MICQSQKRWGKFKGHNSAEKALVDTRGTGKPSIYDPIALWKANGWRHKPIKLVTGGYSNAKYVLSRAQLGQQPICSEFPITKIAAFGESANSKKQFY